MYTDLEMQTANRTSRSRGAVGANPLVYRYFRERCYSKGLSILDFGAGKDAVHTHKLRAEGWEHVTAHDFGDNVNENHDPDALRRQYDVVLASNVLNVQQCWGMMRETIDDILHATRPGGVAIVNYPQSPRKCDLSLADVQTLLLDRFEEVEKRGQVLVCTRR